MKVVLFGATGMLGQGVLRECLLDPEIDGVLAVGRRPAGVHHAKLREVVVRDLSDLSAVEADFAGIDACFYCLGVSSAGMREEDYRRVTYDLTMVAARVLARRSPGAAFVYISGTGTDSTERGRTMWARVKGATENALLAMPDLKAYMFRPGYIQPMHGERSSTKWTRVGYAIFAWLYPVWKILFPSYVTTTEDLGRAMIRVAKHGAEKRILETPEISEIARVRLGPA
jgi:uncharacterized protein YbjT (DUF2867 family)